MRVCAVKCTKCRAQRGHVALAQLELLLGQHDDAAAFGRFVGQRGELRRVGQFGLLDAGGGEEGAGLAVAERDGAGLVEQQHVHVAGGLDRAARGGDHVGLHHAAHAGHADGRQQAGDGGRDQAHQQRHQHHQAHRLRRARGLHAEHRERQQRDDHAEEDDGQRHQQDRQRDLVGRLLALGVLDHRDHAVDEGLARIDGHAHDDPVRQHARAAGHGREVAAGFADHRRRFAGDGALVDRGHAVDHLAVGRDDVAGLDQHDVALAQVVGLQRVPLHRRARHAVAVARLRASWPRSSSSGRAATRPAPCCGPRPAPRRSWRTAR